MLTKTLFFSLPFLFLSIACSLPLVEETVEPAPDTLSDQQIMLSLVNDLRKKGCQCGQTYMPPTTSLSENDLLNKVAQIHATDMYHNQFFRHQGSDGSRVSDRAERIGYRWKAIGENISGGYPDIQAVFASWRNSPEHCKNMMTDYFQDMGLGRKGSYWVQTLGSSSN